MEAILGTGSCSLVSTPHYNPTLTLYGLAHNPQLRNVQDTVSEHPDARNSACSLDTAEDGTAGRTVRIGCQRKVLYAQLS